MADVKLLKYDGTEQQYKGVERVQLATITGGTAIFSEGEAVEGVEISPDFSSGDMPVIAPTGSLVKSAYIMKPAALKPENIRKGVNVAGVVGDLIGDTEEIIVNLEFPAGESGETELYAEQTVSGFVYSDAFGCFVTRIMQVPFVPVVGESYIVNWDGERYERTAFSFTAPDGASCVGVGNTIMTGANSGEPFLVCYDATNHMFYFFSTEAAESHTISVKKSIATSYSDMIVTPTEDGKVMSKVTIVKPEALSPENVRAGVTIGGIEGAFDPPDPVETEVELNFADGPMEVLPDAGKVFDKITIPVPDGLSPENIVKGVTIAGIVGESEGGGGSFDDQDPNLKYFAYKVNSEAREIVLYGILYSQLFADTGSYDVTVPDKLGGYSVVIASEGVM